MDNKNQHSEQHNETGWVSIPMRDISYETFGKYCTCTMHKGLWYADEDFGLIFDGPKWGSVPSPRSPDRRPWRGTIMELIRRSLGAKRL